MLAGKIDSIKEGTNMKNYMTYMDKYNEFTRALLCSAMEKECEKNVVVSPLSVIIALCLTARAAGGTTREEILSCISDGYRMDEMLSLVKELTDLTGKADALKIANAVCVREDIRETITDDYIKCLKDDFHGKLFATANIEEDVNSWVNEHTKGMIDKLIDGQMSDSDMITCLLNAIAFESDWEEQYEDDDIRRQIFTNADGSRSVVDMLGSEERLYIEDNSYTGFIKPYKNGEYAFMALLPKHKTNRFMLHDLKAIDFSKLYSESVWATVRASIPEFKYTYGGDISGICSTLGIKQAFTQEADFSPMTSEWTMISSIIHKAHIELDRRGTKAAAATAAMMVVGAALDSRDEIKYVKLDRPFVYTIMHNETGLPVFTGIVNQLCSVTNTIPLK